MTYYSYLQLFCKNTNKKRKHKEIVEKKTSINPLLTQLENLFDFPQQFYKGQGHERWQTT